MRYVRLYIRDSTQHAEIKRESKTRPCLRTTRLDSQGDSSQLPCWHGARARSPRRNRFSSRAPGNSCGRYRPRRCCSSGSRTSGSRKARRRPSRRRIRSGSGQVAARDRADAVFRSRTGRDHGVHPGRRADALRAARHGVEDRGPLPQERVFRGASLPARAGHQGRRRDDRRDRGPLRQHHPAQPDQPLRFAGERIARRPEQRRHDRHRAAREPPAAALRPSRREREIHPGAGRRWAPPT